MEFGHLGYFDGRPSFGELSNASPAVPVPVPSPTSTEASELLGSIDWGSYLDGAGYDETMQITVKFANSEAGALTLDGIPVTPNDWTAYELQQVKAVFDVIETYIDVNFFTVDDGAQADLTIMVDNYAVHYGMLGLFMPPDAGVNAGHGVFFRTGEGWDMDGAGGLEPGGTGFATILHETMHGLGLAHPHDEGGASTIINGLTGSAFSDMADHNLNQSVFTVMSLVDGWQSGPLGASQDIASGQIASLSPLDIGLLQSVYGPAQSGAGDDLYLLGSSQYQAIWDISGVDEISAAHLSDNVVINLNAASLQYEMGGGGFVSHVSGIYGGFTIAHDAVIENAVGGAGNDVLTGNTANNNLTGGMGADQFIIEAGGGLDVINDFEPGIDRVFLPKADIDSWAAVSAAMRDDNAGLIIDMSGGHSVQLSHISRGELSAVDFGFAQSVAVSIKLGENDSAAIAQNNDSAFDAVQGISANPNVPVAAITKETPGSGFELGMVFLILTLVNFF